MFSKSFIWRRVQSLTGVWFVLFLIEHLLTNSQAALLIGDDGSGFVESVNAIKSLPYLPVIEIFLLGVPFAIHAFWGIKYIFTSKYNSFSSDGSTPSLTEYPRNKAFTWQRLTAWFLLVGIIAHVIQMRFIEYPSSAQLGTEHLYVVRLNRDEGLYTLSKRIGFEIYDANQIQKIRNDFHSQQLPINESPEALIQKQENSELTGWIHALEKRPLQINQVAAVAKNFGVAELLMVRDTFKSPIMIVLYSALVLAACFHGFNGLWTSMIRWGITLTAKSQLMMRRVAIFLMIMISFLGLAAIWGTYWLNLKF
ncbi:MAG: succinate dehydrogenase [Parachlamydiaceae bacterium]|nr:succinate dehydrogenase [Parachlamydiaceae bacterium]